MAEPPPLFELPKMPESGALGGWASESARQLSSSLAEPSAPEPLYTLSGSEKAMPKKGRGAHGPRDNLFGFMVVPDANVAPVDVVDGYKAGRMTAEAEAHRARIERSRGVAHALKSNQDHAADDDLGGYLRLQSRASNERSTANKQHGFSDEADPLRGAHKGTSAQSLRNRQHGVSDEVDIFAGAHKGSSSPDKPASASGNFDSGGTDDAVFQLINSDGTVQYVRASSTRGIAQKSSIIFSLSDTDGTAQSRTAADNADRLHFGAHIARKQVPMSTPYATMDNVGGGEHDPAAAGSLGDAAAGSSSRRINEQRSRSRRHVRDQQSSIFSTDPPPAPTAPDAAMTAARLAVHPNSSAAARSVFGGAEERTVGLNAAAEYDAHFAARYSTSQAAGASSHFLGGAADGGHRVGGKGGQARAQLYSGAAVSAVLDQTRGKEPSDGLPSQHRARGRPQAPDPSAAGARPVERPSTGTKGGGLYRPPPGDARSLAPFDTPLRPHANDADDRPATASSRRPRARPLPGAEDDRFVTTNMANARISAASSQLAA